ncbi:protein PLASTID MOVEMENT IMPAIRED 2 isoform X3 [Daucus carota subsp. sativus]
MDYASQVKMNAESEIEASSSMILSYSSLVEEIRTNIDELNEEHVLVAVARVEALREYTAIEAERNEEAKRYMIVLEKIRKKLNNLNEEAASAQAVENELAVTTADVNRLKSELALIKEMDIPKPENAKLQEVSFRKQGKQDSILFLHTILEESEAANKELAAINEGGFQLMSSMDVIREELKQLAKEKARLREMEDKTELTIQSVNSKLLRAKSKLEALSAAEEKANSMSSSLAGTLKHLREEAEASKKERALDLEEIATVKSEVLRTKSMIDLDEAKLQASIEELRAVKLSEAKALKTLKALVGISVKARATSQHNSNITISTFEYVYLKGHAVEAKKVADKKVEAAQAWTEALRTSEKEILMETIATQQKIRVIGMLEEEAINFGRKHDQSIDAEQAPSEVASSSKSGNRYIISTPGRRLRHRRSGSAAGFYMSRSSITIDRRRKGMQNISKFFSSKDDKRDE